MRERVLATSGQWRICRHSPRNGCGENRMAVRGRREFLVSTAVHDPGRRRRSDGWSPCRRPIAGNAVLAACRASEFFSVSVSDRDRASGQSIPQTTSGYWRQCSSHNIVSLSVLRHDRALFLSSRSFCDFEFPATTCDVYACANQIASFSPNIARKRQAR